MNGQLNKQLSPHFILHEMIRSHTAIRLGIDNTPSAEIILNGMALASNVFEPTREEFGVYSPQSWYRCEALERVLTRGSFERWARWQQRSSHDEAAWQEYFALKSHPKGEAGDIEIAGVSNDALFDWIKDNLEFDELIREFAKPGEPNSGWVHVSYSLTHNRGRVRHIG